ncbi:hypothetical protein [Nostoc sp. MG11]|uniref:hypothetical protein n=1 Tax=Nostoc sp. MG11 TaxID=2721166 RepID=UPI0018678617|nr:hypothetical protein [Nostoc sp. MG11]
MLEVAIFKAFAELPNPRRSSSQRHTQAFCPILLTLVITAGNREFLAIGDWLRTYKEELIALFNLQKKSCFPTAYPSCVVTCGSATRFCKTSQIFGIEPLPV